MITCKIIIYYFFIFFINNWNFFFKEWIWVYFFFIYFLVVNEVKIYFLLNLKFFTFLFDNLFSGIILLYTNFSVFNIFSSPISLYILENLPSLKFIFFKLFCDVIGLLEIFILFNKILLSFFIVLFLLFSRDRSILGCKLVFLLCYNFFFSIKKFLSFFTLLIQLKWYIL